MRERLIKLLKMAEREALEHITKNNHELTICESSDMMAIMADYLIQNGVYDTGHRNSGNWNSGHRNSGYWNSGDGNSGYWNSGDWNSGDWNSGNWNSGDRNSGNWNSGIFNSCNYSNGVFCSESPKINVFNVKTEWTMKEFMKTEYYDAIMSKPLILVEWIEYTEEEKKDPEKAMIGGWLKTYSYKEACKKWWDSLSKDARKTIKSIPNFDIKIFEEITGIYG